MWQDIKKKKKNISAYPLFARAMLWLHIKITGDIKRKYFSYFLLLHQNIHCCGIANLYLQDCLREAFPMCTYKICFSEVFPITPLKFASVRQFQWVPVPKVLFELEFYSPVNTVKVILNQSVNLPTLFLGRLSPLSGLSVLESVEGKERQYKRFHVQSPWKLLGCSGIWTCDPWIRYQMQVQCT